MKPFRDIQPAYEAMLAEFAKLDASTVLAAFSAAAAVLVHTHRIPTAALTAALAQAERVVTDSKGRQPS